jgi:short-subunit dehydrogenase
MQLVEGKDPQTLNKNVVDGWTQNRHGWVLPLVVDLSKPDTIQEAAKVATNVNIVVNNAGIISLTDSLEGDMTVEQLQEEMSINAHGFMHMAQAFAPISEQSNGCGILLQLNSVASLRCAVPSVSTYRLPTHLPFP